MSSSIDTAPIKKAYNEISTKINDLNSQATKYNIKTILKVAFLFAVCFAIGACTMYGIFALAGIALPLVTMGLKEIAIMTFAMGISMAAAIPIGGKFNSAMAKTQNEFLSKMNGEMNKQHEEMSFTMRKSLFNTSWASPIFTSSSYFTVDKIELDSYETVEKRYVKKQEKIREKQNKGWFSSLRSNAS